ncbi:MAG: hypothetical protein KGH58_00340 [Candidatus Micrarchaeota archaeon]|nr:hypothetical protein [Candidatus Micrarchaeota archaeon]
MTESKTKETMDQRIEKLERDGTWTTFNKAVKILAENKDKLTIYQMEKIRYKMQCTVCNRVSCDHQRPE